MKESERIFKFAGLVFRPAMRKIEVERTHESITLTPVLTNLLLVLVEKAGDVATYDELRLRVWPHEPKTSGRVRHTMQVTKGQLIKLLETVTAVKGIIESQPGGGYRFNAEVTLEVLAF